MSQHRFPAFCVLVCLGLGATSVVAQTPTEPTEPTAVHAQTEAAAQATPAAAPETKPAPELPDGVILFTDGDRISGSLRGIHKDFLTFSANRGGEMSVQPSEIVGYKSTGTYAIFKKGVRIALGTPIVGKVSIHGEDIFVIPETGAPIKIEAADVNECLDNDQFVSEMTRRRPWYKDWRTQVGLGASVNRSTEDGTALNTEASAERTEPAISFLPERSRTSMMITDEYERVTSPGLDIDNPEFREEHTLHANAERDQYLHKQFFMLATYTFDRDHSQLLLGQDSYGIGLGWTIIKKDSNELILKSDFDRRTQDYDDDMLDTRHYGQKISQTLSWSLPRNLQLNESFDVDMAYTDVHDISGRASVELRVPLYRSLGLEFSASDDYLNDPSPGTDRDSYRFVTRLTYSF